MKELLSIVINYGNSIQGYPIFVDVVSKPTNWWPDTDYWLKSYKFRWRSLFLPASSFSSTSLSPSTQCKVTHFLQRQSIEVFLAFPDQTRYYISDLCLQGLNCWSVDINLCFFICPLQIILNTVIDGLMAVILPPPVKIVAYCPKRIKRFNHSLSSYTPAQSLALFWSH